MAHYTRPFLVRQRAWSPVRALVQTRSTSPRDTPGGLRHTSERTGGSWKGLSCGSLLSSAMCSGLTFGKRDLQYMPFYDCSPASSFRCGQSVGGRVFPGRPGVSRERERAEATQHWGEKGQLIRIHAYYTGTQGARCDTDGASRQPDKSDGCSPVSAVGIRCYRLGCNHRRPPGISHVRAMHSAANRLSAHTAAHDLAKTWFSRQKPSACTSVPW